VFEDGPVGERDAMAAASRAKLLVTSWNTIRYELLNTRISDLHLRIEGSPVEPYVQRVLRELESKGFRYRPRFYLTDSWGCPDRVPAVGIPFYLADRRLMRIEEEQTGEVETPPLIMMLLRHEVGHAINYAYRLWRRPDWKDVFGQFTKPYHDRFRPDPGSRRFVRHLTHSVYGRNYAQKHPDEDFAETFAVWLTPRSGWRRKYRLWSVMAKLRMVARLMTEIRGRAPVTRKGSLLSPADNMTLQLAEHYGQRTERYRTTAQGYVDDRLREVFPGSRGGNTLPVATLIRRWREDLCGNIERWSGLPRVDAESILDKLADRADALNLQALNHRLRTILIDLASVVTSLAMDFAYTGQFTE